MIKALDAFHRKQLRYAIGIFYPRRISNVALYEKTGQQPWSTIIKERRLRVIGHACRMNPDTPARQALDEALRQTKRKQGRPKLTWLQQVKNDLIEKEIKPDDNLSNVIELASNRKEWKAIIKSAARRNPSESQEVASIQRNFTQTATSTV